MGKRQDFNRVVENYRLALGDFVKGNPEPNKKMFSYEDDVTLANPFGASKRGWDQVSKEMERATSFYKGGEVVGFASPIL